MASEIEGKGQLLHSIKCSNLLSFGPDSPELKLSRLNMLIGPNGCGKSNVLSAIDLMRSTPRDPDDMRGVHNIFSQGGGIVAWLHGGKKEAAAQVDILFTQPPNNLPLRHCLRFGAADSRFELLDERVELSQALGDHKDPLFFYKFQKGKPVINSQTVEGRKLQRDTIDLSSSILHQRRDPEQFPQLSFVASSYENIRIYREWQFGKSAPLRYPQSTGQRRDRLEEDFSNLSLFLNRLKEFPDAKDTIQAGLKDLYDGIRDFDVRIDGPTAQVYLTEGRLTVPATRLSDGTLRYLCLLAILCDPEPPPLICIEEPELGLHPDILPKLADLLKSASERTQLIVTTHSDVLVDAMSDTPENVLVCEKHEGKTSIKRLERDSLKTWLENYTLGQLWTRGQIGGTRW